MNESKVGVERTTKGGIEVEEDRGRGEGRGGMVVRLGRLPAAATRGNLTTLCREMGEVVGVQVSLSMTIPYHHLAQMVQRRGRPPYTPSHALVTFASPLEAVRARGELEGLVLGDARITAELLHE